MFLDLNFTAFWVSFLVASVAWTHAIGNGPMQVIGGIATLCAIGTGVIQYATQD